MNSGKRKVVGSILLVFVFFICLAWWQLWSVRFAESTLRKLAPGMTQAEVYGVLGAATETNQAAGPSGPETWWIYERPPVCIRCVVVEFDNRGQFIQYV